MKYYFKRFAYRRLQNIVLVFNINVKAITYLKSIKKFKHFQRRKVIVFTQAITVALRRNFRSVSRVLKGFEKVASMNPPPSTPEKNVPEKVKANVTAESDVKNVSPELNASAPGRRANIEPNPLNAAYENHPFFDGLHHYLQSHSVNDIWRPSENEYQFLQHNNPFPCIPPANYSQQFNAGAASQRPPTYYRSAAEQAWYSTPMTHPSGTTFGPPFVFAPPRSSPPATFSSAAEQAWYSIPPTRPNGPTSETSFSSSALPRGGSAQAAAAPRHPTTTFSSAAEQDDYWYNWSSTPPPRHNRPPFETTTPLSSTPGTPSNQPFFGSPFSSAAVTPASSFNPQTFAAVSASSTTATSNFQRGRGSGLGIHRSSSSSLGNSMYPYPETSHPSSLPNSPRPSRGRGMRGRPRRNPSTHDYVAGTSSKNESPNPRFPHPKNR